MRKKFKTFFEEQINQTENIYSIDFVLEYDMVTESVQATMTTSTIGDYEFKKRFDPLKSQIQTRFNLLPKSDLINMGLLYYNKGKFKPNKKLKGKVNLEENACVISGFTEEQCNTLKDLSKLRHHLNQIKPIQFKEFTEESNNKYNYKTIIFRFKKGV